MDIHNKLLDRGYKLHEVGFYESDNVMIFVDWDGSIPVSYKACSKSLNQQGKREKQHFESIKDLEQIEKAFDLLPHSTKREISISLNGKTKFE